MNKTTIYLDDEVRAGLQRISRAQDRSQAEIIREILRDYVHANEAECLPRKIPGLGAYRSGRSDLSVNAKRIASKGVDRKRGW
jgi:hypothetical protein